MSWICVVCAAVSGIQTLRTAADLLEFLAISSTPVFLLSIARSSVPVDMPPLADFAAKHMFLVFALAVVFWLTVLLLSLGVLGRREWARRGAVGMLYLLSAISLLLLLCPQLAVPQPLVYRGVSMAPEFNSVVMAASLLLRLVSMAAGGVCLWWALALDRGGFRKEFKTRF